MIAVGPAPLKFLIDAHKSAFPGVPIVFCLPNRPMGTVTVDSDFTGVEGDISPGATVAAALKLKPDTKHVVVVGGISNFDLQQRATVEDQLKPYAGQLDVSYLNGLAMPEIFERLRHLPDHTVVLMTVVSMDGARTPYTSNISGPLITAAANAPVFSLSDRFLNHGEVGGDVSDGLDQGKVAGNLALQILNGKRPADIPPVKESTTYMFDWGALKYWGMKERDLPAGSILINRPVGLLATYKQYIIAAIGLLVLQTFLIVGLLWQRRIRSTAEAELAVASARLQLVVEASTSVGWDLDLKTGVARRFGDLATIFGSSYKRTGTLEDFRRRVHQEDREMVARAFDVAKQHHKPYELEFRVVRDDGMVHWLNGKGQFYYGEHGNALRMLGMASDITERKRAEEALSGLTRRLIETQEEERRRIAREIHDDYSQRIAMLAFDLENLAIDSPSETRRRLHEILDSVGELGIDLHSLSHRLHSSTLESLGLVAGIKGSCHEFAEQQGMQVDFVSENVPRDIPKDSALCLFRITQEGLRNVKKHSGAHHAEVRLEYLDEKLHLAIVDSGKGFDPHNLPPDHGIGLQSMSERLRMQGGNLEVCSKPTGGTRLDAWLPLKIAAQRAS
ncbi:MAG TPA: PAS domain-containing protein [Terriglobales bacterium]